MTTFADRLADAARRKDSCLVVGLDPALDRLPADVLHQGADRRDVAVRSIATFLEGVIECIAPVACAVKPQIAFYEEWGPAGLELYASVVARAREAGLIVIGDVKRGDIGSTAAAYARAHLDPSRGAVADAITVNPYFGTDGMAPFLTACREHAAGLFVLVRTSNPSASELQDLILEDGRPVHESVASSVVAWGEDSLGQDGRSSIGAVVGATVPHELQRLRSLMPRRWLLLPGVGAQGATADQIAPAFEEDGLGALVNSSRGILYAPAPDGSDDWRLGVTTAATTLRDDLRRARDSHLGTSRPAS